LRREGDVMANSRVPVNIEEVERALHQRLRSLARRLRVLCRDGRVVLQGTASTYYAKQLAQSVVLQVCTTTQVVNEIEVRFAAPGSGPVDDATH
jgi:osmotically-inducible protein OsmY